MLSSVMISCIICPFLIMGMSGAVRRDELTKVSIDDIRMKILY
jgi:hypothetical protein